MKKLGLAVVFTLIISGIIYWQKPPDSPVFVSAPGKVTVGYVRFSDNIKGQLEFLDELNNSFAFRIDDVIGKNSKPVPYFCENRCRISFKLKSRFTLKPGFWERNLVLVSVEQL